MASLYPRRLKDLPSLDSDEDSPPRRVDRENNLALTTTDAKRKSDEQNTASGFLSNTNQGIFPKRTSELPKLDSDSELEESLKNDNLNCAILNDSFLLSPCKNEQNDGLAIETPAGKLLKHMQEIDENSQAENLSFVSQFDKLDINVSTAQTAESQNIETIPSTTATTTTTSVCPNVHHKLESILENENSDSSATNALTKCASKRKPIANTPFKPATNIKLPPNQQQLTASKNSASIVGAEGQFATPQVRSFSVQRRPRDLCSTQSQKSRLALANEFRSQKVLFQTPITLSRAPLTCPNDSVTLSLCDETGNTPSTIEKNAEKISVRDPTTKTKKSLEDAFTNTGKENRSSSSASPPKVTTATTAVEEISKTESTFKRSSAHTTINNVVYEIIRKLGCGGSSSVYLAQRLDNGRECALKVVDLKGDPAVVEGYMNETKLLAKLQGNICVVGLYDYELLKKESRLFLVMEKGDSDLQKILQTYTTNLPLYVLMNYLYQMLQAVNYIHQNGVIHSDLKPANFLMVHGRLKLIDFGIASNIAIDSTSIIKFSQAGTFNYISPEALTDTSTGTSPIRRNQPKIKISTKSDVWSLGCILYLFLYQKTPFSHIKNIYAKINAISSPTTVIEYPAIPAYYPIMLVHMVKNCLQHNPKQRPSCAELLQYPFHMIIPLQNLIVPTTRTNEQPKQTPM